MSYATDWGAAKRMWQNGARVPEICGRLGVTERTLRSRAQRGAWGRRPKTSGAGETPRWRRARVLYDAGYTLDRIAARLGVTRQAVSAHARAYWPPRDRTPVVVVPQPTRVIVRCVDCAGHYAATLAVRVPCPYCAARVGRRAA